MSVSVELLEIERGLTCGHDSGVSALQGAINEPSLRYFKERAPLSFNADQSLSYLK
jgi:hypothetical protein